MNELPELIRAFVAVPLPEEIRAGLREFQTRLRCELGDVSWTRPESMHLTLRFLGNITSQSVEPMIAALRQATATFHAFPLSLGKAGSFGNRVLWMGLEQGTEPLQALAERVRAAVKPYAVHNEERGFNAHITLGRLRNPARGVRSAIHEVTSPRTDPWTADSFELIRSELSPHGSRYTTLARFPLAERAKSAR